MQQYFKMLKGVAESDPREFKSIKKLTIELARSSGYYREVKMKKDGTPSKYTLSKYKKWDEPLVAKWLLYYKNIFVSTLSKHPKLEPMYCYIISRVYQYVFQGLKIDELKSGASVTFMVKRMLALKIGEALYETGTEIRHDNTEENKKLSKTEKLKKKEKKDNREKALMRRSAMVNYESMSMDQLLEENNTQFSDPVGIDEDKKNDLVMILNKKFEAKLITKAEYNSLSINEQRQYQFTLFRNKVGKMLLEAIFNGDSFIDTEKIMNYIKFDANEINSPKKKLLTSASLTIAYNIIINELKIYLEKEGFDISKFNWEIKPKFKLNNTDKAEKQIERTNKIWKSRLASGDYNCINYIKSTQAS